jgi:hypothetical protein
MFNCRAVTFERPAAAAGAGRRVASLLRHLCSHRPAKNDFLASAVHVVFIGSLEVLIPAVMRQLDLLVMGADGLDA